MSEIQTAFTRPVTKEPDDLAVPGLPGVCPEQPHVEVFFCCAGGLGVRFFSLAQYARARSNLDRTEPFDVRVYGSLV